MKIQNSFSVPLPPAETWAVLNDVERVVPCLPGAELIEAKDDRNFVGRVAVRLGPVQLRFRGTVTYEKVDPGNLRVDARAKGHEEKGRGAAQAVVTFGILPDGSGSQVDIETDLQLVGSIAQYARGGKLVEIAAQLIIDEFANNLRDEIAGDKREGDEESSSVKEPADDGAQKASPPEAVAATAPSQHERRQARPLSAFRLAWMTLRQWLFGSSSG